MSELEEQLLAVWRRWPLDAQRDRRLNEFRELGLTETRALQIVNRLLTDPTAMAEDPTTVGRLRRLRDSRVRSRPRAS